MKNISVKILLVAIVLIFVNCDHKSSFHGSDLKNTMGIQHILTDTLDTYLKKIIGMLRMKMDISHVVLLYMYVFNI